MKNLLLGAIMALVATGCNTESVLNGFGDSLTEGLRENYVFLDACPATEDLDACSTCCEQNAYEGSAILNGECGCQNTETNDTICPDSADGDACRDCCDGNGYSGYFYLGDETSGTCSCSRPSKEPTPQM